MKNKIYVMTVLLLVVSYSLHSADKQIRRPIISIDPVDDVIDGDDNGTSFNKDEITYAFLVDDFGKVSLKPKELEIKKIFSRDEMVERYLQSIRAAAGCGSAIERPISKKPFSRIERVDLKRRTGLAVLASCKRERRELHPELVEFFSRKRK